MNIIEFENKLSNELLNKLNYNLFIGSKMLYNSIHKEQSNYEVIIEPFPMRVDVEFKPYYDTTITMWVLVKKDIANTFETPNKGKNSSYMQFMLNETKKIFELINESNFMMITKKIDEIPVNYYDNETVNSQIITRSTLNVRIYN